MIVEAGSPTKNPKAGHSYLTTAHNWCTVYALSIICLEEVVHIPKPNTHVE